MTSSQTRTHPTNQQQSWVTYSRGVATLPMHILGLSSLHIVQNWRRRRNRQSYEIINAVVTAGRTLKHLNSLRRHDCSSLLQVQSTQCQPCHELCQLPVITHTYKHQHGEIHTQTHRQTDRHTHTHTYKHTDRQTAKHRSTWTDKQKTHTSTHTDTYTDTQTQHIQRHTDTYKTVSYTHLTLPTKRIV